ncbi:MAG: ferredoxin [Methanoregula sp.]
MNVSIDRSTCVSCGSCWDTCPWVFRTEPDDSFSQVIVKSRLNGNNARGTPSPDLTDCIRDAADLCPCKLSGLKRTEDSLVAPR